MALPRLEHLVASFSACRLHEQSASQSCAGMSTPVSVMLFMQRFRPMSLEKPKVLLPLVGVPMINYTLEWLASNKMAKASLLTITMLSAPF